MAHRYNTRGPQNLGFISLASAQGTANAFSGYDPNVIIRNFYWHHGSADNGWFYRLGRITPDAILATSKYISPVTTFFSNAGTGLFSSGYPDSGMGAVAGVLLTDRLGVLGLVSDAYADRFDFGQPGRGNFYTAGEIAFKQWPLTPNAGYSKLTIGNQPGGLAIIEAFYRFPLVTDLDVTVAYQYVINPAYAVSSDPESIILSDGSAFSVRLRLTF